MTLPKRIMKFLEKHKVNYEILQHRSSYTSLETAEEDHVSGRDMIKAVMVRAGDRDLMLILPASRTVDLLKLEKLTGEHRLRLEEEVEFASIFSDCEPGATPPLGKLYKVDCYADESIRDSEQIIFNAGTHQESIKMYIEDFERIVRVVFGDFSVKGKKVRSQQFSSLNQ